MSEGMREGFANFVQILRVMDLLDVIDILCVAWLLYLVYKFIRDRRAGKLAIGLLLLIIVMGLSEVLGMSAMKFILQNFFQIGLVAVVVVFQPELRSALEKMGEKIGVDSIASLRNVTQTKDSAELLNLIDAISEGAEEMGSEKTGALIVIERKVKLGDVLEDRGTVIDGYPSVPLLKNIFFKNSPLHDGALIVRDNRLYSGGCVLPLAKNPAISKELGTRHRAAIGVTEASDAVVVVVSEETGTVSVAFNGQLERGFTAETLKECLQGYLSTQSEEAAEGAKNRLFAFIPKMKKDTAENGGQRDEAKK